MRTTTPPGTRRRAAILSICLLALGTTPATAATDTTPCDPATGLPCGPTQPPSPPSQCTPSPPPQPGPPDAAPQPVPTQPPTTAPLPTSPGPIASLGKAGWDNAWKKPKGMVALQWTPASGAVSYKVKITPGKRCTVCKTFRAKGVPEWHETRNTFYEFHGLQPKGKYRVEVRGVNSYGAGPVKARILPATW